MHAAEIDGLLFVPASALLDNQQNQKKSIQDPIFDTSFIDKSRSGTIVLTMRPNLQIASFEVPQS